MTTKPPDIGGWLKEQQQLATGPLRRLRVLAPLHGLLIVGQSWLIASVIHAAVFEDASRAELLLPLLALLPVFLLRFFITMQVERQAFHAAVEVKRTIRALLYDKFRALGPVRLANEQSGVLATSVVDGVESLDAYFARFLPAVTMMSMVPPIILLAVLPSDPLSAVVLLMTAPLVPLFMHLVGKGAEHLNQKQWRKLARMGAHFLDVIQTFATRKMFNATRRELDNIARISDEFRRSTMAVLRVAFLTSAILEFFAALSIALIAVFIGFRLLAGDMSFLYGFFVLLLVPEFYLPLRNYGAQNHARMEAVGAAEEIVRLLDMPTPEHTLTPPTATGATPELAGAITLTGVYYSYETGRPALENLSLQINPGEHVAIVGSSGAGKSTLANLLLGFATPDAGTIHVGGTLLDTSTMHGWRQQLCWIPQRSRLFHGSVADNIRLGAPHATSAAVESAAAAADARDFIDALPQGFDTIIGDAGLGLSGGQIQRLAIARALLRDTPYLLLDEPTAHLDRDSEQRVVRALRQICANRTIISIAHRLQTLQGADRILVLHAGQLVQQGGYDELSQTPGPFSDLLRDGRALRA